MNVSRYRCSVLAVDDDPDILTLLRAQLGTDFTILTATTVKEAHTALARRSVDVVLSDFQLPDGTGVELLDWVRRNMSRTARVLLTGTARMQDAVDAINQSQVHRLVLKPWRSEDLLQTLRAICRGLLLEQSHEQLLDDLRQLNQELERRVQSRTLELEQTMAQLEQKNAILERMALTDPLTGLPNRRAADLIARKELLRRARAAAPIAMVVIDADHFGQVNRDYSLTGGDQVLVWLTGVMQASIRAADTLCRVGGEEFLVIAPETDMAGAETLAERLRANVEASHTVYDGHTIKMTISIGAAVADAAMAVSYEQLRAVAAEAEKEAKCTGRNRFVIRAMTGAPV